MQAKINGTLLPVRTAVRHTYDPSRGPTITQEFESAGDNLNGLASGLLASNNQYDHTPNPKRSKLTYTQSGPAVGFPDITADSWQLLANELQKDIKEHPKVMSMDPELLQDVLQAVEDFKEGGATFADEWFTGTETYQKLFQLLIHGVTSYSLGQYVLKHTTNVSNVYDTNVADLNVERIYTTADLLAEISNASYWTLPCPGRLRAKINAIEVQVSFSNLIWGWRKLPSTETTSARNRIDISTEYWLAGWSNLLYLPL